MTRLQFAYGTVTDNPLKYSVLHSNSDLWFICSNKYICLQLSPYPHSTLYKYNSKNHPSTPQPEYPILSFWYFRQISNKPMAQIGIAKSFLLAYAVVALSAVAFTVSAQAPAPSPDAGDAFSLPVSGAVIGTTLLFSLFALLRHWVSSYYISFCIFCSPFDFVFSGVDSAMNLLWLLVFIIFFCMHITLRVNKVDSYLQIVVVHFLVCRISYTSLNLTPALK